MRNSRWLSIKFLCVTLWHMSIRAGYLKTGVQGDGVPLEILLNIKIKSPLPRQRGNRYLLGLGAGGAGGGHQIACPPSRRDGGGIHPGRPPSSAKTGSKKEGRSIVYSPAGWYDNAPTLSHRGCAALKVVELRSTPRKLFVKSLTKNFSLCSTGPGLWPLRPSRWRRLSAASGTPRPAPASCTSKSSPRRSWGTGPQR